MASRGLEWKVGLVVLAATFLFIAGVVYLGQVQVGRSGKNVRVAFPEVGGLSVGDPVMVSGLRRGSVTSIELGRQEVLVTLKFRHDVVLHADSRFRVENMGIMGEKFVAVSPGVGPDTLATGDVLSDGYSPGITEAMAQLGVVLEDIGSIVARVEGILKEHEFVVPLEETIHLLRNVSVELDGMLTENRSDLRSSIKSFRTVADELEGMMADNRVRVDTTLASAAEGAARFRETMEKLDGSIESLDLVIKRLEHGQGTLGQLSRDDRLYKELLEATQSLNDLLQDVRKNPKRYLKIEVF